MSHLDEGTLHALLDGELDLAEVSEIQKHLGSCVACGSRLQEVKQVLAEADRLVGAMEVPASASRGPAVAASTQPKTSTASASVATAPMPVRRLTFTRPAFMVMPPPPRAVRPRGPGA